ncbi:hypothetical protein RHMOL_Rhmol12G0128700 [Rhododendron molle]|uniref:Uncharacterized protein n=1 Tax=Rhododendron molle TaxID=49168 RepID=A0ACC0LIK0_RHOML|nr:hypothetical protein RHMOL_Rhmol12G0128700 [Rhododendron molle]
MVRTMENIWIDLMVSPSLAVNPLRQYPTFQICYYFGLSSVFLLRLILQPSWDLNHLIVLGYMNPLDLVSVLWVLHDMGRGEEYGWDRTMLLTSVASTIFRIYVAYMDAAWNLIQLIGFSTFNGSLMLVLVIDIVDCLPSYVVGLRRLPE